MAAGFACVSYNSNSRSTSQSQRESIREPMSEQTVRHRERHLPFLPSFVEPMHPRLGQPFRTDRHLFEVKWDGVRGLAFRGRDGYRLVNRRRADMTGRYPELACLAELPPGAALDGEIIVLRDGLPDFAAVLRRDLQQSSRKARLLAKKLPATLVVFDVVYAGFRSVMNEPLEERRARAKELVEQCNAPAVQFSEALAGDCEAVYRAVCDRGLEGIVAKRLGSRYIPGKRSDAWIKMKRRQTAVCVIIGFLPAWRHDFQSLLVATEENGAVRFLGQVGTGFDDRLRERLNGLFRKRVQPTPAVPCKARGAVWVSPDLFCRVAYQEEMASGELRALPRSMSCTKPAHGGIVTNGPTFASGVTEWPCPREFSLPRAKGAAL